MSIHPGITPSTHCISSHPQPTNQSANHLDSDQSPSIYQINCDFDQPTKQTNKLHTQSKCPLSQSPTSLPLPPLWVSHTHPHSHTSQQQEPTLTHPPSLWPNIHHHRRIKRRRSRRRRTHTMAKPARQGAIRAEWRRYRIAVPCCYALV